MGATTESSWSGGSRAAWLSAGADCCCGGFAQAALPEASAAIQKTAVHSRMMVLNLFLIDRYKFMVVGPFLPCAVRSQPVVRRYKTTPARSVESMESMECAGQISISLRSEGWNQGASEAGAGSSQARNSL